jgi:hypothetical protein
MQLERGRLFLWRDFLINCFFQGLNFFPTSRWYKIMSHEGLAFFDFLN